MQVYDELIKRDKVNLDIFWLKDDALEDSAKLPAPGIIATEIVEDLRTALAAFEPLWDTLVTRERVRLLRLVVEKIAYDAASGDVAITFRPGGLQALAQRRSA